MMNRMVNSVVNREIDSSSLLIGYDSKQNEDNDTILELFTDTVVLNEYYHNEFILDRPDDFSDNKEYIWRMKERMKTSAAVLVVCLNIGTDPPDIVKPNPCARKECWMEPILPKQKGLEIIGNALQSQYERLHSKVKYKQCLDPTVDDLRRTCMNQRKIIKNERLLFHYNGHGVPRPTKNGEIWLFGRHYTHYLPVSIQDVHSWLGDPIVYLFDCSAAGVLISQLIDIDTSDSIISHNPISSHLDYGIPQSMLSKQNSNVINTSMNAEGPCIVLAACKSDEVLPMNPLYPADLFTCCLTTPIPIALRYLILQNPYSLSEISLDIAENFPGKESDRKTPRGELNWIFTAITDTIAFSVLPPLTFQKIFRQDMMIASLFRNLLLAKRIMKTFSCTPQSWPIIPDTSHHHLWQTWDFTAESCLLHVVGLLRGLPMLDPKNNMPLPLKPELGNSNVLPNDYSNLNFPAANLPFFTEQLTAFEIWLNFGGNFGDVPIQLPILLQVLLSHTHRLRALMLLKRYLSLGPEAINSTLVVGIFPYICKLLQSPINDIKQVLVCIWSFIIGFDPSCRQELLRDKSHNYFIIFLNIKDIDIPSIPYKCLSMFILSEICNGNSDGQLLCLQQGLHRLCTSILVLPFLLSNSGNPNDSNNLSVVSFIQWTCLCLTKLLEDFVWAKYLCITEEGHTQLYPYLQHYDPTIRTAAVLTLGECFGASLASRASYISMNNTIGNMSSIGNPTGRSNSDMSVSSVDSLVDPRELREAELKLAISLLTCFNDGNVLVRYETIVALGKFIILPAHIPCLMIITKQLQKLDILLETPIPPNNLNGKLTGIQSKEITDDASSHINSDKIFPWNILPHHTQIIVDEVITYLETQGIGSTPTITPDLDDFSNKNLSSNLPIAGMMAAAYVKFWLTIYEIRGKDPSINVAKAANQLCQRVFDQIQIENKRNKIISDNSNSNRDDGILRPISLLNIDTNHPTIETFSNDLDHSVPIGQYQPLSPLGLTSRNRDIKKRNIAFTKPTPMENMAFNDSRTSSTSSEFSKNMFFGVNPNTSSLMLPNTMRSASIDGNNIIISDNKNVEESNDNSFELPISYYYYWVK